MTNSTLTNLRNALANRRKAKALALRLALRKAEAMEAVYGTAKALPLWEAYDKANRSVQNLTPPTA